CVRDRHVLTTVKVLRTLTAVDLTGALRARVQWLRLEAVCFDLGRCAAWPSHAAAVTFSVEKRSSSRAANSGGDAAAGYDGGARVLCELGLDGLEGVRAGLSHLRAHVLGLGDVEVLGRFRISETEFVERADPVAHPFARHEDRAADVKAKGVVLERGVARPDWVTV